MSDLLEIKAKKKGITLKKFKKFLSNTVWVYKEMFRISKLDTSLLIISSIIMSAIPTIQAFFSAKLIDEVIGAVAQGVVNLSDVSNLEEILFTIGLMAIAYFIQNISRRVKRYYNDKFRRLHFRAYELEMLRKISQLDIQQFEDADISDSIQKAQDNFYKIQVLSQSVNEFFIQLVTTTIAGIISFTVSPWLFAAVTILSIPNNIIYARFIKSLWDFYNTTIERNRKGWWLRSSLASESDLPEHKITGSSRYIYDRVKTIFGEH